MKAPETCSINSSNRSTHLTTGLRIQLTDIRSTAVSTSKKKSPFFLKHLKAKMKEKPTRNFIAKGSGKRKPQTYWPQDKKQNFRAKNAIGFSILQGKEREDGEGRERNERIKKER